MLWTSAEGKTRRDANMKRGKTRTRKGRFDKEGLNVKSPERFWRPFCCIWILCLVLFPSPAWTEDQPQWGQRYTRNMVSDEKGLPGAIDLETGENVKWTAPLGDNAYGCATIGSGKVLIGANNEEPRDPRHQGDRSVLLCLDEKDGRLLWQLVVPRLQEYLYLDWPEIGMSSPPTIEGDRVYTLTNRFEVVCLDLDGQADGNDGPYQDEGRHMALPGDAVMDVTDIDADIVWLLDMKEEPIAMAPHDASHSSILLDGRYLYINTCNGIEYTNLAIRRPDAPSLIVVDKETGRLVATDGENIGPKIYHSTWSSPSLGVVDGRKLIFFGGGDGVCYAFEALDPSANSETVQILKRVWRFDCDPDAPKEDIYKYAGNRTESPSNILGMPVFHNNRIYVAAGGDVWWGKREAWIKCIDATGSGDITGSGERWSYPVSRHCSGTPAIADNLLFITDCGGYLHCLDAESGKPYWTRKLGGEFWGSPLIADGKVYAGSRRRELWIFAAKKREQELAHVKLDAPIGSTPVAANGVLYVTTMKTLYAFESK